MKGDARIVGRAVPTAKADYVPGHARRSAQGRWTITVTRSGRTLRLTMVAPDELTATLSERELEAAAWAYTRSRGTTP